ncbi:hypothetical protein J3F84DRAFT_403000 [Trichoderma pleuroticola]
MANLKAKLMFDRDLEDAFFHVIKYRLSLNVQDVKAHNVDFFICPPKKLQEKLHKYGCWCDEARTAPHNYKYCDNIKGIPYPSIIGKDPSAHGNGNIPLCPDLDENVPKRLKDHNHRLGCFKPVKSADIFMDWFMQQGVKNYTSYPECRYETKLVRKFVDDYMRQVSAFETCEINKDDGEDMVLGLLLGFQGRDATDAALKSHVAWEAERLLKFLRWNEERFKTCLEELRSAMDEVIKMRSTNSFQGGRSRREWERPRRSPLGEQYGREESPKNQRGGAILQKNTTEMRGSGRILQERDRGGALQGNDTKEKIGSPALQERDLEEKMGGGGTLFQKNNLEEDMGSSLPLLQEEAMSPGCPVLQEENLGGGWPILQEEDMSPGRSVLKEDISLGR